MDPSLDLTKAILEGLRRDLRSLGPGDTEFDRLDNLLRKAPRYLRKLQPSQLLLPHAAVAARFLGFTLAERIRRVQGTSPEFVPCGAENLFRRYPDWSPSKVAVFGPQLATFIDWGHRVTLGAEEDVLQLDLSRRLRTLGFSKVEDKTVQKYALLLFQSLTHRSPVLSSRSALDLANSLSTILENMPQGTMSQRASASLLAVAFYLESLANNLELRQRLYSQGSKISEHLDFPLNAVWCWRQHLLLAALRGDEETLTQGGLRIEKLIARLHLHELVRWAIDSGDTQHLKTPNLSSGILTEKRFLLVLRSERRTSKVTDSDRPAGGSKAMTRILRGEGNISLDRYLRWVAGLEVELEFALDRVEALDLIPPDPERLLQGIRLRHGDTTDDYSQVAEWSKSVELLGQPVISKHKKPPMQGINSESERISLMEKATSTLSSYPKACTPEIAADIADHLLLVAHFLMETNRFNDGLDAIGTAIRLHQLAGDFRGVAADYRQAAYLALHVGQIDIGHIFLGRSRHLDLTTGSLQGFALTTYAQALFGGVQGNYAEAYPQAQCCLYLSRLGKSELPELNLHSVMGNFCLALGDLEQARLHVTAGDELFSMAWPAVAAEFLGTKADFLSQIGSIELATETFNRAQAMISTETGAQSLALLGLSKCGHFVRHGFFQEAMSQAREIMNLSWRLKDNPIGQEALRSVAHLVYGGGSLDLSTTRRIRTRVEFPNLFSK